MNKEIIHITSKELKKIFNENPRYHLDNAGKVILIVNNRYRIFMNGLDTEAEREDNPMIRLKVRQAPQYIRNIIE